MECAGWRTWRDGTQHTFMGELRALQEEQGAVITAIGGLLRKRVR